MNSVGVWMRKDTPKDQPMLANSKGLDGNAPAVGANRDQAIQIGAENFGPVGAQALQHLGVWMPEGVFKTVRDQGEHGRNGVQKRIDAGGVAAVVPHLENVGAELLPVDESAAFHGLLHVTGEQERALAIGDAKT